jgi:hypothetical protein
LSNLNVPSGCALARVGGSQPKTLLLENCSCAFGTGLPDPSRTVPITDPRPRNTIGALRSSPVAVIETVVSPRLPEVSLATTTYGPTSTSGNS